MRVSLLFVGDLYGYHHEWFGYMTKDRHGVTSFDFAINCVWL